MKRELQELFSGLPTVRIGKDGAIIEKPANFEYSLRTNPKGHAEWNEATEVTPVPDWMEFWEYLEGESCSNDVSDFNEYWRFVKRPLSLSDFIPCNENGEPMEEPVKKDTGDPLFDMAEYNDEMFIFEPAVDRVVWWGWEINSCSYAKDGSVRAVHSIKFGDTKLFFTKGKIDGGGINGKLIDTISNYNTAINNGLPLYLEVV